VPELERRPPEARGEDTAGRGERATVGRSAPEHREPGGDTASVTLDGPEAAEVVELLDDEYAREILEELDDRALAAADLVEECDASSPTVYRRLNRLQEHGLVAVGLSLSTDGHHRKVYRSTFAELSTRLGSDGLEAELVLED
jgi:DNA-binding HxlR family transcriptional regulator